MSTIRTLKAGTILYAKGSASPVELAEDAKINFPTDSDSSFAGWLIGQINRIGEPSDRKNFELNIHQLAGIWDPVTGRNVQPEPVEDAPVIAPLAGEKGETPLLVRALQHAAKKEWTEALNCYNLAKTSLNLTDAELVAKGQGEKEQKVLFDLSKGLNDGGHAIPLVRAKAAVAGIEKPVPPLVQAIRLAMANQWSDALAVYRKEKTDTKKTDAFLIKKGANERERAILTNLAKGTDDKGKTIFLAK